MFSTGDRHEASPEQSRKEHEGRRKRELLELFLRGSIERRFRREKETGYFFVEWLLLVIKNCLSP